ncbi:MAG TPA: hypothetical protein G4N98_07265 [Thermoflexia bacterium]|nr:hypothetical protein [Thermoflexia bacterium]
MDSAEVEDLDVVSSVAAFWAPGSGAGSSLDVGLGMIGWEGASSLDVGGSPGADLDGA